MRTGGWRVAALAALAGCSLEVADPGSPEVQLATPAGVTRVLSQQYIGWHQAVYGTTANLRGGASVMAFESFSQLPAGAMGVRVAIPRQPLNNSIGNAWAAENRNLFINLHRVARNTALVLGRLDDPDFTMGSVDLDARTRAFAHFVRGLALGYLALMHDSAAVITPDMHHEDPGELEPYGVVMEAALGSLTSAIAEATARPGGFPLPDGWVPSSVEWTADEFIRLARSYRARLRASVARDPAERAAVNWAAVTEDARQGVRTDHLILTTPGTGPSNSYVSQWSGFGAWHQMPVFVIGMADTSGAYAQWLALPLLARPPNGASILLQSPDLRFPQGDTRDAQRADLTLPCAPAPCRRYFRNRTSADVQPGYSWGWSQYDHVRFHPWATHGDNGVPGLGRFPFLARAELDLLEAEGLYRAGDYAGAAALINRTRVANGLPAITAFDPVSPVPGGTACVPRVPVAAGSAGGGTVACGTLFEALKYEKRLETQFTHFAGWFLDMRGWGDLVEGTGLHWPVPYEELLLRLRGAAGIYHTGGLGFGNTGSAGPGTYGW
jgi:hypothetical protein